MSCPNRPSFDRQSLLSAMTCTNRPVLVVSLSYQLWPVLTDQSWLSVSLINYDQPKQTSFGCLSLLSTMTCPKDPVLANSLSYKLWPALTDQFWPSISLINNDLPLQTSFGCQSLLSTMTCPNTRFGCQSLLSTIPCPNRPVLAISLSYRLCPALTDQFWTSVLLINCELP